MKVKGKRRTVWWLLAIVVLGLAIWGWRILNAPLPNYQTLVVRKGDLQQSVLATGKLDALRKLTSAPGQRTAENAARQYWR